MTNIEQWKASGSPYKEGVALYEKIQGHNKVLLKNFKRKHSLQLHEKLKYELSKFANSEKQKPKKVNLTKNVKPAPSGQNVSKIDVKEFIDKLTSELENNNAIFFHELPPELREVYLNATQLFREMCLLKVQLNELPEEAETTSLQLQIEINTKQKENALLWSKLDYWQKHRTLPKQPKGKYEGMSAGNLVKQEQYHYAAISKLKARLSENKKKLESATTISEINKLERAIAKQESNLIKKNDELFTIKRLIDVK